MIKLFVRTRTLSILALALTAGLSGCGGSSSSSSSAATEAGSPSEAAAGTDAAATTPTAASSDGPVEAVTELAATSAASSAAVDLNAIKPCEVLTAEEFSVATGLTVTASDTGASCEYKDDKQRAIADLTVTGEPLNNSLVTMLLDPGRTDGSVTEVPGIGERAVVISPPEGRGFVLSAGIGYQITKSFGGNPLTAEQMTEVLRSIVAE